MTSASIIDTDAVVIGAGPVGLFQVFQLGLLGLRCHLIDVLPEVGGQCVALYPDKPIYDIPGITVCSGRELALQLLQQARPFLPLDAASGACANLHLGHLVSHLTQVDSTHFEVQTDKGLHLRARKIFIAAGAGAFMPRTLNVSALDGAINVHYHLDDVDSAHLAESNIMVAGGGEEAVSTVLQLASATPRPARIRLLHRRDQFQVDETLQIQLRQLIQKGEVELVLGMPQGATLSDQKARSLQILSPDGQARDIDFDALLIRQGMSPKLGPVAQWGLALERKQVPVSTATFESQTPGIHAVGDINTYPGKKRLLLCGFHEATLAAHAAAAALSPDAPPHLLYTTTSPLLHQRLGISGQA